VVKFNSLVIILSLFILNTCLSSNYYYELPLKFDSIATEDEYFSDNFIRYDDYIYSKNIKTALLYESRSQLNYPIINLNGGDKLKLSFDEIGLDYKTYAYTFIHCNANWEPSELEQNEYLTGFMNDYIEDYKISFNTDLSYVHYNVEFPNTNVKFKVSGNYIVKVYEDSDSEKLILTKRFMVLEKFVDVDMMVKEATRVNERFSRQEIDFKIDNSNYEILDPFNRLNIVLMQNYRWDNAITGLDPRYVNGSTLDYNYNEENVFDGNNEFRNFDLKSLQHQTIRIRRIQFENIDKLNHAYIVDDKSKSFKQYLTAPDLNGNFIIKRDESSDSDIEADYLKVHFSLPYSPAFKNGDLYVVGKFTDWKFKEEYKLDYDLNNHKYFKEVLLKQGYYNYMYCFVKDGSKNTGDFSVIEGSHQETENDYIVLVYHRKPTENYDRLIGLEKVNSINR